MNILVVLLLESVAGYAALLATLGTMSALGLSTASFLYRLLASYGMLLVCAIYGVFASIAFRLVGQHRSAQWTVARAFKYAMAIATGVRFEVVGGREHLRTRPAVLVANHQTALDVLFLGEIFPKHCSVTAKKSLKRVPFLGWFMALSGTVFIDRANRSTALKAFEGAAAEMKEHRQSVLIFPEGTRSYAKEPMLLGFKKGAFHLAVQAQVPIVPIVSACYSGVLGADEWRFRRGTIPVVGECLQSCCA
jgi:lysophosphatidate acyltransferase